MLQIDVSRGEKVILPVENCTGSANFERIFGQDIQDLIRIDRIHLVHPEKIPVNPVPSSY